MTFIWYGNFRTAAAAFVGGFLSIAMALFLWSASPSPMPVLTSVLVVVCGAIGFLCDYTSVMEILEDRWETKHGSTS